VESGRGPDLARLVGVHLYGRSRLAI
jgi:hypothetical protein